MLVPHDAPIVVAATVTYGSRHESCIQTCKAALAAGADKVVIISNGSSTESTSALVAFGRTSGCKVVLVDVNEGSAPGFARAINADLEEGAAYVWLLDDDNKPEIDALERAGQARADWSLSRGLPEDEIVIACYRPGDPMQGRLVTCSEANPSSVYNAAGSFLWRNVFRRRPVLGRRGLKGRTQVPSAPYGGLLVPRLVALSVAGPRADFVLYQDDTDYTERIVAEQYNIVLVPDAIVRDIDRGSEDVASGGGMRKMLIDAGAKPVTSYYMLRNTAVVDTLRASRKRAIPALVVNATVQLVLVLAVSMTGRAAFQGGQVVFKALIDALLGNMGRRRDLL